MTNYTADEEDEENYSECEEYDGHENFGEGNVEKSKLELSWEDLERLREQILKETEALLSKALGEGKSELDASSVVIREDNHMALEDSEGDDDAKSCFPCPFCYVDIEVPLLCSHLEEEHCFNFKNAVCPLCAANLGKDVIAHFTVHHASSFKHRRKSQKSGLWPGSSAMLGKALLKNGRSYAQESAPDPLLSPFICNISFPDPTGIPEDVCSDIDSPVTCGLKSGEPSPPDEACEKDREERRQRATFVQELIASTIFLDI
ncbi:hypothetical protein ACFX2H_038495 [Malus domestica]